MALSTLGGELCDAAAAAVACDVGLIMSTHNRTGADVGDAAAAAANINTTETTDPQCGSGKIGGWGFGAPFAKWSMWANVAQVDAQHCETGADLLGQIWGIVRCTLD